MLLLPVILFAANRPQIINQMNPSNFQEIVQTIQTQLQPTLPAPGLYPEPDYTLGNQNAIYWDRNQIQQITDSLGLILEAFYIEAHIDTIVLWAPIDVNADSALFMYLPEGIEIYYQFRYYAKDQVNHYMSHWSNSVSSIQDAHIPVINSDS